MSESYQVETGGQEIADALLAIAKRCGWTQYSETVEQWQWLTIRPQEGKTGWNAIFLSYHTQLTIPEAVKLLEKGPTPKVRFRIKNESPVGFDVPLSFEVHGNGEAYLKVGPYCVMGLRNDGTFRRIKNVGKQLGLQLDSEGRIQEHVEK